MSASTVAEVARDTVLAALATVRDPELDESITDLDFVQDVRVDGPDIAVDLRLPTYFCAPNFAFLMVADAYDAILRIPGVQRAAVRLLDHFASEEINAGVAAGGGFAGSFPGLADGELAELRLVFQRKAHQAAQERVAAGLLRDGWTVAGLACATVGDAAASAAVDRADLDRLARRRGDLGLPADPAAALLLGEDGRPMTADQLPVRLRLARTTGVSIEANAGFCRGLLDVRYGPSPLHEHRG